MKIQRWAFAIALLVLSGATWAQKKEEAPTAADLKATAARGRLLAEYDVAAWHATDAVEALKPDHAAAPMYLAQKIGGKWEVVFGRMSPQQDKFLILYRATQGATPQQFTVKRTNPSDEDQGFYFEAAKAIETAARDFGKPDRPYNTYILPSGNGQLYVYFLPAQTTEGVYPLGGDVRYTVTLDGGMLVTKRQMHTTIIETKPSAQAGQTIAGTHTHVLNNEIEDSDVFHVLTRRPAIPEYVATPDKHLYEIKTDGSIARIR
jgi:hypothetical protein